MPKFEGKNSLSSVSHLARERVEYALDAFPSNGGMGPPQIMNFNFAERTLYGRVDRQHNPIIPKMEFITPCTDASENPSTGLLMNFVALQWSRMQKWFRSGVRFGMLSPDDPILSILTPYYTYYDPKQLYSVYLEDLLYTYAFDFLADRVHQVKTFNHFLHFFPQFVERLRQTFPISFSGFQRSNNSSIFTSGLAIDIGNIPFDNDTLKEQLLLDNPSFPFYMENAIRHGFSVNKLNPGVLVCDLESPATAIYRNQFGLPNLESIFSTQYEKTLYSDLEEITKIMVIAYNSFVARYPFNKNIEFEKAKAKINSTRKNLISLDNINNNISNKIISLYITIRNIEERKPYPQNMLDIITRNALRIKKISERKMLDYIDDQFKDKYNLKNGSLTYHKKRNLKKLDK